MTTVKGPLTCVFLCLLAAAAPSEAGTTKGTGAKFNDSATGTLPSAVKGGQSYDCPLTVSTPGLNGWPATVEVKLKSRCWADLWGNTTIATLNRDVQMNTTSVTFNATVYVKKVQAKLVGTGDLWWEVKVTPWNMCPLPSWMRPKSMVVDTFSTSVVKFTVTK
jgi:hypothetical protein